MKTFDTLALDPILMKSLEHMKYNEPTPIQAQAIPLALEGRDIMGSAQTGTGKTAAFAIPLIQKLLSTPHGSALVLTPTRELGKQIMDIMHQLLGSKNPAKCPINTAFIIGGEPMGKQFAQLRRNPRLIVGTPGRINDHLERGTLKLKDTQFLVLDETDRMLDMGFSVQLDRIAEHLPTQRQTLMFSATLPKNIIKLSAKYLNNPERVSVGSTTSPVKNIKQDVLRVNDNTKYSELVRELGEREGSIIIFVKTKHGTERLAKRLNGEGFKSDAIHGDLKQGRRNRVIQNFRQQEYRILVATDVVARGLDIPHIEHVINYDLPQVPEDYIHRIGRTARAGAEGSALCLVTPQDQRKWQAIDFLMNPEDKPKFAGQGRDSKNRRGQGGAKGRRPFSKGKKPFSKREDGASKEGHKHYAKDKKPFVKREDGDSKEDTGSFSKRKKPFSNGKKPFSKNGKASPSKDNNSFSKGKKSFYGQKKKKMAA